MKTLKNGSVGFLVSFVGSIPLGYLNIIGYDIFRSSGINAVFPYLLGVIVIEAVVIYGTLVFANQLSKNKKLIRYIELFSIFFMLLLAWSFYSASGNSEAGENHLLAKYIQYPPLVIGLICSSLNFIQIPFWTGWNLYLINANYIQVEKNRKFGYLIGTLLGTFSGMLALILALDYITRKNNFLSTYLMSGAIPLLFLGMALLQAYKFWKKYYQSKTTD
ncbi:hypothetical protein [Flavobacterium sp.]|uniref:hypothetical protein n=1 Tax=Flavobacterium sp. TaxID=239 RepID=UPI0026398C6A|nr:hypothetical protein [Flavobacterium sp.]